jgi:hypothetical protein
MIFVYSRPSSFNSFFYYYLEKIIWTNKMSSIPTLVPVQCLPLRAYFSASNMKSIFRGFVYEYETPKIVTIHSISSKTKKQFMYTGKSYVFVF